jgi:hypothetical protein
MDSNARSVRVRRTGRALPVFAACLTLTGVGLAALALIQRGGTADEVLAVDDAVAVSTPFTVAPLATVPATLEPVVTTNAPTPTTLPLSPLAALLGERGTAIPPEPPRRPRSLTIETIELWGPIRPVGLEPDGELEIPDETEIGWYQFGSAPGLPGATVLAAHVTWNDTVGPFYLLRELEPGDRVDLELDDGSTRTYEVVERTMYDKDKLPAERVWSTAGDETLVMITCGGSFNPEIHRYRQNVVVYAVPVAQSGPKLPLTGI